MSKLVKKRIPRLADDDFSRAFSGVQMFSDDEYRLRQIDCIVVDDNGRPAFVTCDLEDEPFSSVWLS